MKQYLWLLNEDSLIHEGNSPIIIVAGNLNIRGERIYVKSNPREGLRVPFCLGSLDTQGGTIKTKNATTERRSGETMFTVNVKFAFR